MNRNMDAHTLWEYPVSRAENFAAGARFRLPPLHTVSDLVKALPNIMREVARGRLSAQEGEAIARMLDSQRRAIETEEFDARLKAIEKSRAEH